MKKDKIVWRGSDGDNAPVKCFCEEIGYPNYCETESGNKEQQFDNTHFDTQEKAWVSINDSCKAELSISARAHKRANDDLIKAMRLCAKAVERYEDVFNNPENLYN